MVEAIVVGEEEGGLVVNPPKRLSWLGAYGRSLPCCAWVGHNAEYQNKGRCPVL